VVFRLPSAAILTFIIDATVIEAKQSRKRKGRNGNNTQDPEADYNVKIAADGKRKTTYGYKMHANTDEDGFSTI
jgi:IS5 family transposase